MPGAQAAHGTGGRARRRAFDKKLPRMLERSYAEPHSPTKHMLKDVGLVLREAQTLGLVTPALEGVRRLFEIAVAQGLADADYSAVSGAVDPPGTRLSTGGAV